MMDSLRSATQNTMFEQWLHATMQPALQAKESTASALQVCHLPPVLPVINMVCFPMWTMHAAVWYRLMLTVRYAFC